MKKERFALDARDSASLQSGILFLKRTTTMQTERGFTLIELLVVIAIIGLLASIILASLSTAESKARDAKRLSDLHSVEQALELYWDAHGRYPPVQTGSGCGGTSTCVDNLTVLVSDGDISALPTDPTHTNTEYDYRYSTNTNGTAYELLVYSEGLLNGGAGWCYPEEPAFYTAWSGYNACQS